MSMRFGFARAVSDGVAMAYLAGRRNGFRETSAVVIRSPYGLSQKSLWFGISPLTECIAFVMNEKQTVVSRQPR